MNTPKHAKSEPAAVGRPWMAILGWLAIGRLVFGAPLPAQPQILQKNIRFERLTVEQGLSQNSVFAILQDRRGWMWFGTRDGLNQYDGHRIKIYGHDPEDPGSLSGSSIRSLCEDRRGGLWIGAYWSGLNYMDPDSAVPRFTRYQHDPDDPQSLSNNQVWCARTDRNGKIWIGTHGGGLNMYDPDSPGRFIRHQHHPDRPQSLSHDWVRCIYEDRQGRLWIGTVKGGLNRLDPDRPGRFERYRHEQANPNSLSGNEVFAVHQDAGGALWIGTEHGLNRFNPERGDFTRYRLDRDAAGAPGHSQARAIHDGPDGTLWIGSNGGGLLNFDPATERFHRYPHDKTDPHGLGHPEILTLYGDRTGVVWIGTRGGGVNRFNPKDLRFGHYRLNQIASLETDPPVHSLLEARDGALWIGTAGAGALKLSADYEALAHYKHQAANPGSLSDNWVTSIHEDRTGTLWLGTAGGGINQLTRDESRAASGTFIHHKRDPANPRGLAHDGIVCLYEDREGFLWVGTSGAGLHRFNPAEPGEMTHYPHRPSEPTSLSNPVATCIAEDRKGYLWVGTYGGLNRIDPERRQWVHYRHDPSDPTSLSHDQIHAIYEDRRENLWIATRCGLNKLTRASRDSGRISFVRYFKKHGLPSDLTLGLLGDGQGFLWISANRGLARFNSRTQGFQAYDARDGLQGNEFVFGAFFKNANGRLFWGGTNGFNAFHPAFLEDHSPPPPVAITDFRLNNVSVVPGEPDSPLRLPIHRAETLALSFRDRVFSFEFAVLDYAAPEKNRYAYKMEGLDDDWIFTDASERIATYTNLSPGEYRFRVKGGAKDGAWNHEGASIRIKVRPPPWRTGWAYALYGLVLALLALAAFRSHRNKLARERTINEDLERKVAERTQALETKQQRLVAQAGQLERQAGQLRRMDELKTTFFTNISHEFRTPLTLTLGPLEDLLSEKQIGGKVRNRLEMIRRNARRLMNLINELLDISKLEAGRMGLKVRSGNLVSFVKACRKAFLPLAEARRVAFMFQADQKTIRLYFDPDKLEKALANLLSNAFKFTPETGKILIGVSGEDPDWAVISVKDTGKGIPKTEIPYVFDRFYQGRDPGSGFSAGSGVGLSLAKELIELHGGRIEARSDPGFGCQFTIRLPKGQGHLNPDQIMGKTSSGNLVPEDVFAVADEASASDGADEPTAQPDASRKARPTLLIVEDHSDMRAYLRDHLKTEYLLLEADCGETGLELAREKTPDLVISDVMMPGMDGFALCHGLKQDERTSHIPVILLTAKAAVEHNIQGLETGADDYLVKPFHAEVLKSRIANLIKSRRKLRERFREKNILGLSEIAACSADRVFLQKAVALLERRMGEPHFGVYEMADELGFSRRQLHRKLTALTGKAPADFIKRVRLERAAQLLKRQAGNISEIAYAVGFKKPKHFSLLFREAFGKTPTDYASQHRRRLNPLDEPAPDFVELALGPGQKTDPNHDEKGHGEPSKKTE